ncbi:hematological/neurological-like protein [Wolffia australiana]
MERSTPVRKSHTSTADLLTWTENQQQGSALAETPTSRSGIRTLQAQSGSAVKAVVFGGEMTETEAEALLVKKQCSGSKWKEMTGSGIFSGTNENDTDESDTGKERTSPRVTPNVISQISFSVEETLSLKKPTSLPEVAKQRELSGNLANDSDSTLKKQVSSAKFQELSGHDIFGPPPEIVARPLAARILEMEKKDVNEPPPRPIHTSVKVSNPAGGHSNIMFSEDPVVKTAKKIHNQKFAELSGNNIFEGTATPSTAEKALSNAKLREMSGSNIFADGESNTREYYGGVRKPPGGESSISLV